MTTPKNAMESAETYRDFYEHQGATYDETATVYGTKSGRIRFQAVMRVISTFAKSGLRMLDVGCNDGVYTIPYCKLGGSAHGIDISPSLIEKAKERAMAVGSRATFEIADIEAYHPLRDFNLVLMSEVLEHLRNPGVAVQHAIEGMRPGGHLLLTTPLPYQGTWRYMARLVSRRVLIEPCEFEFGGVRYRHDGYYPLALKDWLETTGLECVRLTTLERRVSIRRPWWTLLGARNLQLHRKPST